eukprot:scaffold11529_cov77-Skeletonema_marinoi.AAC.2
MLTHVVALCRAVRGEKICQPTCVSKASQSSFLRRKLERHVARRPQIVGIEKTRGAASSSCYPH